MCPWRAFHDPYVHRVYVAHSWFEKGDLEARFPSPSERLLKGIDHLENVLGRIQANFDEQDREKRDAGNPGHV